MQTSKRSWPPGHRAFFSPFFWWLHLAVKHCLRAWGLCSFPSWTLRFPVLRLTLAPGASGPWRNWLLLRGMNESLWKNMKSFGVGTRNTFDQTKWIRHVCMVRMGPSRAKDPARTGGSVVRSVFSVWKPLTCRVTSTGCFTHGVSNQRQRQVAMSRHSWRSCGKRSASARVGDPSLQTSGRSWQIWGSKMW